MSPLQATIGNWDEVLQQQVTIACLLTSFLFCFCSGALEAWSLLLAGAEEAAQTCMPLDESIDTHWAVSLSIAT